MKIKFKKKKNTYKIALAVSVIFLFIILILYSLSLINYSIRKDIITIGIFSEKLNSKDMNFTINRIMSGSYNNEYQTGITALEKAGYQGISHQLLMRQLSELSAIFIILFLIFLIGYLLIRWRFNKAYSKEVQEVVDWINNTSLEVPEQYDIKYLHSDVIMSICLLKEKINRQKIIYEENTAQIMNYMENISHQLKIPLAVINATCERLSIHYPNIQEKMEGCITQTDKMTGLIRDFLQLGRFDCNKQKMQFEYIPAEILIETVMNNLDGLAKKKQLSIVECGEKDILWYCDIFWMEEIIGNILKNCIEHSENGEISIVYGRQGSVNQIMIQDCGIGFEDGLEKKIFERYSSLDRKDTGGSGLGLSIAQQAMKSHFGIIIARNRKKGGVEFRLSFPRLDSENLYNKL